MLQVFNPNINVRSRPNKTMSWKQYKNKKVSDYLYLKKSDYPSYKGDKGDKGATLAAMKTDDTVWTFSTPPLEVTWSYMNGNHAPLAKNFAAESLEKSKRTIELRVGSITDKLKSYLINDVKMSAEGIKKLEKDQLDWKEWNESVLQYISEEASKLVVGTERKKTKEWLKQNNVKEGVLSVLYNNTNAKDKVDNVVYGIKGKALKFRESGSDEYFKLAAKSDLMSRKKYPVFPIMKDHRDKDMEPVNMVPSQDVLDKIFLRSQVDTKDIDGNVIDVRTEIVYNQFDENQQQIDTPLIRNGDLVKIVYRPKFYKDSSSIGFTNEIREVHLLKRKPYSVLGKREAQSELNPEETQAELDSYF